MSLVDGEGTGFWGTPCPSRGTALSHAHSKECKVDHGGAHSIGQCCHCGHTPTSWAQSQFMAKLGPVDSAADFRRQAEGAGLLPGPFVPAPIDGHTFIFTMSGRCAICAKPRDDHPLELAGGPLDGCIVDHKSIRDQVLFTSEHLEPVLGAESSDCPSCPDLHVERGICSRCGIAVEPRAITGQGAVGAYWEKGRGVITPRLEKKLGFVQYRARQNGDIE